MTEQGITIKSDSGGKRIYVECQHQNGLIYVVPAESSWVCDESLIHAHALAGFFQELTEMDDARVKDLMQNWGIYYRPRPIAGNGGDTAHAEQE